MAGVYCAADILVATPCRDGMHLVAKAYVACRYENTGALVLSEFAGAAAELKQSYRVNPYDINGMKSALLQAIGASERTASRRMRSMRTTVNENDIDAWATKFLG